jgi:predicted CXXCH cytochrome family protein
VSTRRSVKVSSILGVVSASALMLAAQAAGAGTIVGSAHDFTGQTWSGGQICVACHAPHNTATTVTEAPLWNHALSTAVYTLYSTSTMQAVAGQPGGVSKLCLSCHDGTVAVNSFGGTTGTTFLTGGDNLGINLSNDHPIGITYDAALVTADGALNAITTPVTIGLGGTKTRVGTIASNMLYAGKLECASCHDVHNTFTAPVGKLLKVTSTASAICTTCHSK